MSSIKSWLESDSEDDDEEEEECDHKPIQSELYYNNKEILQNIQFYTGFVVIGALLLMIFVSSWIGIEEGKFPYNIDFMADIAYSKNKVGTPTVALVITFIFGVILLQVRRKFMQLTSNKCYDVVNENLKASGKIRNIKPKPPKQARK